jgi:MFS family permease
MDVISDARVVVLQTPVVWFVALAAALGTASIYPLQPAIADVAGYLHASLATIGVALACGPIGYLLGLALLVPLVERFAPRHVLSTQFSALAIALAVNAAVGTPWLLGLVIGVVGAGSSVGAQLSSVAGRFANPHRRATVLGIVTAGISAGILAGRIVGGWLNDEIGWRGMFLVFAIACAIVGASAFFVLSGAAGSVMSGYLASLRRLPVLDLQCAPLRLAAGRGTLWFFAFCAPWAGSWGGAVAAAIAACAIALAMIVTATVRGKARSLG